jgi:hypothetical protein
MRGVPGYLYGSICCSAVGLLAFHREVAKATLRSKISFTAAENLAVAISLRHCAFAVIFFNLNTACHPYYPIYEVPRSFLILNL